ncbi:MAG: hypothetical protein AB1650_06515 [Candidatus Omnitrophota bacterium]
MTYRRTRAYRLLSMCLSLILALSFSVPVQAQGTFLTGLNLPAIGTKVVPSAAYHPPLMAGMTIYPEDPLKFDFIVTTGDDNLEGEAFKKEAQRLINYFLATLTVPDDEMWVNLSPYEKDRIIADGLGTTEMGRDMLVQDYILKQLTASLMYPEEELGEKFWKRVYEKTKSRFGATEISANTFNKVWIVPEEAVVYVNGANVFVNKSHLKVMLEEDYLALESNQESTRHGLGQMTKDDIEAISQDAKEILKEIILPEIEREVNEGKNFANLRQIYYSMILATWYKKNLKKSILGKVYIDKNKIDGIDLDDKDVKEKIYDRYIQAFKQGVYNYIKEDFDERTQEVVPRRYFSGGLRGQKDVVAGKDLSSTAEISRAQRGEIGARKVAFNAELKNHDAAMLTDTVIPAEMKDAMVREGGKAIRNFLGGLVPYVGNRESSPFADIAKVEPLWEAAQKFEANPDNFTDEKLIQEKTGIPRIELRDLNPETGEVAQVAIIGIPGNYRSVPLEGFQSIDQADSLSIRMGGFMTLEANVGGVNKSLPLNYLAQHFNEILDMLGYTPGTYIDARATRTVIATDGDGTLYGKPTATENPILNDSAAYDNLMEYLRVGGFYVLTSGNDIQLTRERLLAGRGIPVEVRNRFLIVGNGGANMGYLNANGDLVEIDQYKRQSLLENSADEITDLDVVYVGDDEKLAGNDMPGFRKVGLSQAISVSSKDFQNNPVELRKNYIGNMEQGTSALFGAIIARVKQSPFTPLFEEKTLQSIILKARESFSNTIYDSAMLGEGSLADRSAKNGGIDFNSNNMRLDEVGDEIDFQLDETSLKNIDVNTIEGIIPMIINITPIVDFFPLLSRAEGIVDDPQLSARN